MRRNRYIFAGISGLLLTLLFAACSLDLGRGGAGNPPGNEDPPGPAGDMPPVLLGTSVQYDPSNNAAVSLSFNFNMEVSYGEVEGWDISPDNGGKSLILVPRPGTVSPGTPHTVALRAANSRDSAGAREVQAAFMPVAGVFERPDAAKEYRLAYYDKNGAAGLVSGENTEWYYIPDNIGLRKIFNAVYSPNAPENGPDAVEFGKEAVPYTAELSEKVTGLFNIIIAGEASGDKIEIRGEPPAGDGPYRLIVIDIGAPGEDNAALPDFSIPDGALGTEGQDYSHIRFRVNRGAYLRIEADNSAYIQDQSPCPPGHLEGASVEVLGGGKLRNGAYRGFPLGEDTALIARLGSWYARGPESGGWLLGPPEADPAVLWDGGDQNGSYIEIRQGRLAFDVNVTIRKSLTLKSSVWFINGPRLTINAGGPDIGGKKGVFAGGTAYRFYGTVSSSGGQNPAKPAAKIIVKNGSSLSASFLTNNTPPPGELDGEKTIINGGGDPATEQVQCEGTSWSGYLNWLW